MHLKSSKFTKTFLPIVAFTMLLFTSFSYSFIVYLRPPRMFLRTNVTKTSPGVAIGFIEIKNLNNVSMNISIRPVGDIVNIVDVKSHALVLDPNETYILNFTTKTYKTGTYHGKILVTYMVEGEKPVVLESVITVIATGEDVLQLNVWVIGAVVTVTLCMTSWIVWKRIR